MRIPEAMLRESLKKPEEPEIAEPWKTMLKNFLARIEARRPVETEARSLWMRE